jgi:hypothetical protein
MNLQQRIFLTIALLFLAVTGLTTSAGEPAINPTGTWKLTITSTNTPPRPTMETLKLKLSGGTLTGTLSYTTIHNGQSRVGELPITEGKLQGSEISFNFTHPPAWKTGNAPDPTYSYNGKINGDTIKGTLSMEWMGGHSPMKVWQAERLKE